MDNVYEQILLTKVNVELNNEFAPFIRPNHYVDYCKENPATGKAAEFYLDSNDFFDFVNSVFNFIADNIYYDEEAAEVVEFGYMPDLSEVLERGSGICFDIAVLTAAMLRSQGVPAKMVFGNYSDSSRETVYHAWVSVYSKYDGMIGDHTVFNAGTWNILDPLFGSVATFTNSTYHAMFYY